MHARALFAGLLLLLTLVAAGCGSGSAVHAARAPATCPTPASWQQLANRVHAVVLCPTWMPQPLNAHIGGQYANGVDVKPDRSYLVSFLWHEPGGTGEAHVNLRGYPGRTALPRCLRPTGTKRILVPCFADSHGATQLGPFSATLYTANLDEDQWHLLYAWRSRGTLYTASMHIAPPYEYARALTALRHVVTSLIPVTPR